MRLLPVVIVAESWLCAAESLLVGLLGTQWGSWIEPGAAACQVSALPAVLVPGPNTPATESELSRGPWDRLGWGFRAQTWRCLWVSQPREVRAWLCLHRAPTQAPLGPDLARPRRRPPLHPMRCTWMGWTRRWVGRRGAPPARGRTRAPAQPFPACNPGEARAPPRMPVSLQIPPQRLRGGAWPRTPTWVLPCRKRGVPGGCGPQSPCLGVAARQSWCGGVP